MALQLVAILAGLFWQSFDQCGIMILLAAGLIIALIVAWYHGEKHRRAERVLSAVF